MKLGWIKTIIPMTAIAFLCNGCAMYQLEELRRAEFTGTPFQNELAKLYMDFATEEEKEYDWFDSMYFAGKGLRLAYGKDAGPEELKDWNLPKNLLPEIEKSRDALIAILTPEIMHNRPGMAANAQFYFDCWVEQQEENWQEDDIAYCRDNFAKVIQELNPTKAKVLPMTKASNKAKSPKKTIKPSPASAEKKADASANKVATETVSYAVFFEPDKPDLSEPGKAVVDDVISSLKTKENYDVVLRGADKAGPLSKERLETVKKRLAESGIKEESIHTPEHANKSASHRVEIFLNE